MGAVRWKMMARTLLRCFTCACLLAAACTSTPSTLPDGGLPDVSIDGVQPDIILPGTWVQVTGSGFVSENEGSLTVLLEQGGGSPWQISPERISDTALRFRIDDGLFHSLGGPGSLSCTLRVRADTPRGSRSAEVPVSWTFLETLQPELRSFSPADEDIVYLGSEIHATGSGFLLEGEGSTELRLSGTFTPDEGEPLTFDGSEKIVLAGESRERLGGPLPAEGFGIHPGVFHGQVQAVNVHAGGQEIASAAMESVFVELGPTVLTRVEPAEASRGQWIDLYGRGFVAGSARTVIRIVGTFTDSQMQVVNYPESDPLQIVPEVVSGEQMRYVLRVVPDGHGGLTGLGAVPGMLRGEATPVVYFGADVQEGLQLPGVVSFQVLTQKQVVYLSYLPGFTDALRDFGLRNVESQIRDRIWEVIERDYQGINVEFRKVRPTDFVEYAVIEIGGLDPNGMGLMGLDNTMGKDTGNFYFDDVVGGMNADSREGGHYAFGGVFVSSYLAFSPKSEDPMPLASEVFDDVFGPFMESQGGQPVEAREYPDGERGPEIGLAIHALGSMIGNTVSHEIGHTLGLAHGPPDLFHNIVPLDNQIMDAGLYREFEERAELNGKGPAAWTQDNRSYLLEILPR
ncbi:MAG: hypothetical protein JXR96_14375 [Deltaproteobacteria bacterium]|nr:hypothetical protein [Deltaproteobacteria bacterium]